jgi:hypothetical protein
MEKIVIPEGRINVRFRQMRGVWQVFAGSRYLAGASGETPDDALSALVAQYDVPRGAAATIHGYRVQTTTI